MFNVSMCIRSLCLYCFLTHTCTHVISGRRLVALLLLFRLEAARALISGYAPPGRYAMGFAATPDGMLYVFGGLDSGRRSCSLYAICICICMCMLCIYTK